MKKTVILLLLLSMYLFNSHAQDIEIIKAEQLLSRVESESDTIFIVNFWATWCAPCVEELPVFKATNYTSSGLPLKILLVSLDFPDSYDSLNTFAKDKNVLEDILWMDEKNPNSWIDKIDTKWSGALPATKVYKQNQQFFHEGQITQEQLQIMISKIN